MGSIWCSCHGAGASSAGGKTGIGRKNVGAWGLAPPSRLVGLCRLGLLFRLGGWLRRGLLAVSALSLAANCYPAERWRAAPGICRRSSPKNSWIARRIPSRQPICSISDFRHGAQGASMVSSKAIAFSNSSRSLIPSLNCDWSRARVTLRPSIRAKRYCSNSRIVLFLLKRVIW